MPSFLTSGNTPALIGAMPGSKPEHHARLALDLLLAVGVDQEREGHPVGAGRRLDDVREVALVRGLVEVLELLAGELLVPAEVEVARGCGSPSISCQPNGNSYSMSYAALA